MVKLKRERWRNGWSWVSPSGKCYVIEKKEFTAPSQSVCYRLTYNGVVILEEDRLSDLRDYMWDMVEDL